MTTTYIIEGGVGKHIAFTACVEKLAERDGDPIQVYTPYVGVFGNNPNVRMAFESTTLPLKHPDILSTDIQFAEPYKSNWQKGEQHIIESYCELLGIEYNSNMRPVMFTDELKTDANKTLRDLEVKSKDKFIVTQFFGGQTTQGYNPNQDYNHGTAGSRNYHPYLAQAVINLLNQELPDVKILNWGLPNEPQLGGTIPLQCDYRIMHEIAKQSSGFIGTDSSLRHIMKAAGKTGVVIYGETTFHTFGYPDDTNINAFAVDEWNPQIDVNDPRTVLVDPMTVVQHFVEKHSEQ